MNLINFNLFIYLYDIKNRKKSKIADIRINFMSFLTSKFKRASYAGVLYGAIAGLIASWSISTAIAVAEIILDLKISTFYSILGLSSGLTGNFASAAYLGFGLHLVTGAILGAVVGYIITRLKESIMLKHYKGTLIGMAAGIVIWLVLFLPITALLIQPSINYIVTVLALDSHRQILSEDINHSIRNIALAAIAFHLIWGAIFGYIMTSLLRIRAFKIEHNKLDSELK